MTDEKEQEIRAGVIHTRDVPWLWAEDYIDTAYREHRRSCPWEDHSGCRIGEGPRLYGGWVLTESGCLPREGAVYSAIERPARATLQVVKSEFTVRCAKASPCYPDQGDVDTPGGYRPFARRRNFWPRAGWKKTVTGYGR